jgi:ribosomal protein L37E
MMIYTPDELRNKPTLHQGQCRDCKIDTGDMRVWLCRVGGGVTVERLRNGVWLTVCGGCYYTGQNDHDYDQCNCDTCGKIGWGVEGQKCNACGFCQGRMKREN